MSFQLLALLAVCGFVGGIGITTIGPGGVVPTISLFVLTDLSAAEVAGTAIITHIATGVVATAAYTRSGHLREPQTRRTTLVLAATAVFGTPAGVLINTAISDRAFGLLLGAFMLGVALLVWLRERQRGGADRLSHPPAATVAVIGLIVAVAAGTIGIGGPMLTVPLLVAIGVPMLEALASAQAQSVVIATVGTFGYLSQGAIDFPLAALIGIPEVAGVLLGWKIARSLPTRQLKIGLVVALIALAPYIAFSH